MTIRHLAADPAKRVPALGYNRERDLPRLIPMWPHELADVTADGRLRIVQRLRRALREERRRGVAGSWTYDLARHSGLGRALRAELAAMPLPLTSWARRSFHLAAAPGAGARAEAG